MGKKKGASGFGCTFLFWGGLNLQQPRLADDVPLFRRVELDEGFLEILLPQRANLLEGVLLAQVGHLLDNRSNKLGLHLGQFYLLLGRGSTDYDTLVGQLYTATNPYNARLVVVDTTSVGFNQVVGDERIGNGGLGHLAVKPLVQGAF